MITITANIYWALATLSAINIKAFFSILSPSPSVFNSYNNGIRKFQKSQNLLTQPIRALSYSVFWP